MARLLDILYWGIFVAAIIAAILSHVPAQGTELSYEKINCDWNGTTIIIEVPMPTNWTWENKEVVAETICDSIVEYQDQLGDTEECEEEDK